MVRYVNETGSWTGEGAPDLMEQEAPPLHSSLANPPATATPLVEPPDVEMNDDEQPDLLSQSEYNDLDLIMSQSGTHLDRATVRRVYRENSNDVVNTILELTDGRMPASPRAPVDENAPPDVPLTLLQMLSVESLTLSIGVSLQDRLQAQQLEESEPPVTPPRRPTAAAREEAPPPAPSRRRAQRPRVGMAPRDYSSVDMWQGHPLRQRSMDMALQQVGRVQRSFSMAEDELRNIGMSASGEGNKGLPAEELPINPVPVRELHGLVCEFIDAVSEQKLACKDTVPVEFCCPISLMALRDPRCAADGHIYEKDFFLSMAARAAAAGDPLISPMTREKLGGGQLFPVMSVVSLMERWVRGQVPVPEGGSLEKELSMAVASLPVAKDAPLESSA